MTKLEQERDQRSSQESIWAIKPWWCQPWSIVLTGLLVITASWLLFERWWLTGPVATVVILWWWLFLVLVPTAYRKEQLEG